MCGHSLEVNVTTSLDFYLSVAQVQLLQQLLRDNIVGLDAPEKRAEVHQQNQKYKHTSHPSSNCLQLLADNYFCAHPFYVHRAVSFCLNIHHDLKQHPQLSPLTVFCDFITFKYLLAKSIAVLKCDLSLLSCAQLPLLGPFLLFTGQGASRRHLPCLTA